jgi:hypothetical protein
MAQGSAPLTRTIQPEDVVRWVTFTGFWGFVFYLLACVAQIAGRRQPVTFHLPTATVGLGIHLGAFVGGGSAVIALGTALQGKRTTELARERIGRDSLSSPTQVLAQGVGAAVSSTVPLALVLISQRAAARITGTPTFPTAASLNLPRTIAVMGGLSSIMAMAITLIVGWVARDVRQAMQEGR